VGVAWQAQACKQFEAMDMHKNALQPSVNRLYWIEVVNNFDPIINVMTLQLLYPSGEHARA
jgi:hypothetical protein